MSFSASAATVATSRSRRFEDDNVVYIDSDSAARILPAGDQLLVERLPIGTRVIYAPPPLPALASVTAALRDALARPLGAEPLQARLRPGMKVTIAVDDLSVPAQPMRTPDVRQQLLEQLVGELADFGVDDVHIVIARGLGRRLAAAEVKRLVGPKVFRAFWPSRLYHHDAERSDGVVEVGRTAQRQAVRLNRRAVESDLLIQLCVNPMPMGERARSLADGLGDYETTLLDGSGDALVEERLRPFCVEAVLNNRVYDGPMSFLGKNEDHLSELEHVKLGALQWTLARAPQPLGHELLLRPGSAYGVIAIHAGASKEVRAAGFATAERQHLVEVHGQADVLISGIPHTSPFSVGSAAMNPLLVQMMALGAAFNSYRNVPLVKEGGVLILTHPCSDRFDADHHPSYIELFHRLLPQTRDAATLERKYRDELAHNPSYIEMYRRGHAYHGAHPFAVWRQGEAARRHLGRVIVVGADNAHVPERLGWVRAETLRDAIAEAKSFLGRSPEITLMHQLPTAIADVSV